MLPSARVLSLLHRVVDVVRARPGPPIRVPDVRVICVGGLTFGGAGKTPVAMAIARAAQAAGLPTAVVLRGYRGSDEGRGRLVSDGTRLLATPGEAGDEAVLHARRLPGVLVRIGADRVRAVRQARADGARVVVLDDGWRHRRLARDLDVVCVSRGLRREGDAALARADLLVYTDGPAPPVTVRPAIDARLEPVAIVEGPELEPVAPPSVLLGSRVALACAIARPDRFATTVEKLGATVVHLRTRRDHARLDRADLELPRGADLLLTTEKDLVKLEGRVRALRVDAALGRVD